MMTVTLIFAVAATLCTIAAMMGKCPLPVPVFLLCVIELLRHIPADK